MVVSPNLVHVFFVRQVQLVVDSFILLEILFLRVVSAASHQSIVVVLKHSRGWENGETHRITFDKVCNVIFDICHRVRLQVAILE